MIALNSPSGHLHHNNETIRSCFLLTTHRGFTPKTKKKQWKFVPFSKSSGNHFSQKASKIHKIHLLPDSFGARHVLWEPTHPEEELAPSGPPVGHVALGAALSVEPGMQPPAQWIPKKLEIKREDREI